MDRMEGAHPLPTAAGDMTSPVNYETNANKVTTIGGTQYQRLSGSLLMGTDQEDVEPWTFRPIPYFWWLTSWMVPGMGMFLEAYYIFSIGNIKPLLKAQQPACYSKFTTCSKTLTQVPDYIQITGIILGMVSLGYLGDRIGRKWGSVTTISIMLVGAILLTAQDAPTQRGQLIFYIVAQFIFGYGVGGEYPLAASSAAERAETGGISKARHRGREVVLTFSMQGVGNFVNTGVLLILLAAYQVAKVSEQALHPERLASVWRTAFGVGMAPIIAILFYRVVFLGESKMWHKQTHAEKAGDYKHLFSFYWSRMLSTAGCWFFWDFGFYGNKIFQSEFISVITDGKVSITVTLAWTLLNSGIALIGYWFTAALIDNISWGRFRIQLLGFSMVSILFFISAAKYSVLIEKKNIGVFQFIYFFSFFWGQFGPNCTTFLLAGELYPTEVRTTAHGFSAGIAKLGALFAVVFFNYIGPQARFWWSAGMNSVGIVLTLLFTPEPLRVPLAELDRRYAYHTAGKVYHGEAINPRNLSVFERWTNVGKFYSKQLDREDMYDDHFLAAQAVGAQSNGKGAV